MKFVGDNHYYEQIKYLHFERSWNRNNDTTENSNWRQSVLRRYQTDADA